jgi:hypothetical protein
VNVTPSGDRGGRAAIGEGGTKGNASRIDSARDDATLCCDWCDIQRSLSPSLLLPGIWRVVAMGGMGGAGPGPLAYGDESTTRVALPIVTTPLVVDRILVGRLEPPPLLPSCHAVGGNCHCVGVDWPKVDVERMDDEDEAPWPLSENGLCPVDDSRSGTSSGP